MHAQFLDNIKYLLKYNKIIERKDEDWKLKGYKRKQLDIERQGEWVKIWFLRLKVY